MNISGWVLCVWDDHIRDFPRYNIMQSQQEQNSATLCSLLIFRSMIKHDVLSHVRGSKESYRYAEGTFVRSLSQLGDPQTLTVRVYCDELFLLQDIHALLHCLQQAPPHTQLLPLHKQQRSLQEVLQLLHGWCDLQKPRDIRTIAPVESGCDLIIFKNILIRHPDWPVQQQKQGYMEIFGSIIFCELNISKLVFVRQCCHQWHKPNKIKT